MISGGKTYKVTGSGKAGADPKTGPLKLCRLVVIGEGAGKDEVKGVVVAAFVAAFVVAFGAVLVSGF